MVFIEEKREKSPIYLRLQQMLMDEIASGKITPGDRLIPENQLMDKFQVSRTTMRRALRGLEQEGLIVRFPGKGTFVNQLPSESGKPHPYLVGINFFAGFSSNNFYGALTSGILKAAEQCGIQIQVLPNLENSNDFQEDLNGLLFLGNLNQETELYRRVSKGLLPAVGFNTRISSRVGFIGVDYREESRRGVEYLFQHGARRIGFYGVAPTQPGSSARYQGYLDALKEAGQEPLKKNIYFIASDITSERYENVLNFLKGAEVDALFVSLGPIFSYLLHAMNELCIRVSDLKLLCFDDLKALGLNWPGIAYIRMPLQVIGERMVHALRQQLLLKDMAPVPDELFKAEIITGE